MNFFAKNLLRSYYVPDAALGSRDTNKTDKVPILTDLIRWKKKQQQRVSREICKLPDEIPE